MATASDNFDRADSADMGANWSDDVGDSQIISNAAGIPTGGGTGHSSARWIGSPVPDTNDYYVEAPINTRAVATTGGGVMARKNPATGATNDDGYCGIVYNSDQFYITRMDNNAETSLGSWAGSPVNNTVYILRLVVQGNQISLYVNSVLRIGPVTDSTYATGGVGLHFFGQDGPRAESWNFSDLFTPYVYTNFKFAGRPAPYKPGIAR